MKKFSFSLFLLLFSCISMMAQQRSESEAIQIAQEFFGKEGKMSQLSVVSNQKVEAQIRKRVATARRAPAQNQSFYVVNDEANHRFVIVSSDKRFHDILGYSTNGAFDPEMAPPALLEILDGYDSELDYLYEHPSDVHPRHQSRISFPEVKPLIKSKWGQQAPYYDLCPYDYENSTDHPCVTGCVATALAQVMNYYQYPEYGQDSYSYTTSFGTTLSIDYDTVHFEWNKICDTYNYYYDDNGEHQRSPTRSAEEQLAVAKLMKACGVSVAMGYGVGASGAYARDLVTALVKYFKYNPNILYKQKDDYSAEDWDAMITEDLLAGHPILYGGNQGWSGHQFIIDGCKSNGMYHFNFGWNGYDDGYYMLTGTDGIDYNWGHAMVFQITPELYGVHEDYNATKFDLQKINVNVGDDCKFKLLADYARKGRETDAIPFNGRIGVGLFDADYCFVDSLYSKEITAGAKSEDIWNESLRMEETKFLNGKDYIIAPFSKPHEAEQPFLMRNKDGKITYYTAKRVDNVIHLSPQGIEMPDVSGVYKIVATNPNGHPTEWYARIDLSGKASDYEFTVYNIDPAASNPETSRMCYVSGELNRDGTQLKLSKFVYHGADVGLMNYSNIEDDIILNINPDNGQLTINDTWGTVLKKDSSVVSQYTNTLLTPVPLDELELVIAVDNAGELANKISPSTRNFVTSLTITGGVNGTDIKLIRELATTGSLMHLNLSDARIVEGGEAYYKDYKTQNNVIGNHMFYYCDILKSIILPSKLFSIEDYAFYNCDEVESIALPEGINEVPYAALSFCDNLSYIMIPSSVKIIDNYSLSYCRVLKRIDSYVRNVESLKSSSYYWTTAGDLRAFEDVPDGCEWHVVKGLIQKYKDQPWWKDSWSIVDDLSTNLQLGDSNGDGEVDVADVMSIANYIMSQPLPTFVFETSDMDKDGVVDVADLSLVVNEIMYQTPASASRRMRQAAQLSSAEMMISQDGQDNIVSVTTNDRFVAAQFDLHVLEDTDIQSISSEANKVDLRFQRIDETTYRIILFSVDNSSILDAKGNLLRVSLSNGVVPSIGNSLFVTEQGEKFSLKCSSGTATQIELTQTEKTSALEVYTLDGRKVIADDISRLANGLYIVNGKKYIVK